MAVLELATLEASERAGWESLCNGLGGAFYVDIMTEDAVMILVDGAVLERASVAASLEAAPSWATYELSELRVLSTGDDSAVLVYRASALRDDDREPFLVTMASTYVLVDGTPRLALYQQTTRTSPQRTS